MTERIPEKEVPVDFGPLLPPLRALKWARGVTRDQLRAKVPDLPVGVFLLLPSERKFHSPEEVRDFYLRAWARRQSPGIPAVGAAEDGGPAAWGPSPPSTGARRVGGRHGIGSGADSGFTGSDDVGAGRSGASYGPGSLEPEIESD